MNLFRTPLESRIFTGLVQVAGISSISQKNIGFEKNFRNPKGALFMDKTLGFIYL